MQQVSMSEFKNKTLEKQGRNRILTIHRRAEILISGTNKDIRRKQDIFKNFHR